MLSETIEQDPLGEDSPVEPVSPSQVTVVIPAFNEVQGIGDVVRELRQAFAEIMIVVVDDGSTDGTRQAALAAGAKVLRHKRNQGYGASLRTGMLAAATPYIAIYDADGQHRPEDLGRLIAHAASYDMVIGERDKKSPQPLSRRPLKWMLGKVANLLSGQEIPDLNSGLRVMRRSVILRYLHLFPKGFSASTTMTICMLQRGYEVRFEPVTTKLRLSGKSQVKKVNDGLRTIRLMIRLVVLFNPQRFFLPPALAMILLGGAYGLYKALVHQQGIPVLAMLVVVTGLLTGLFGILADQISTLRIELFERDGTGA